MTNTQQSMARVIDAIAFAAHAHRHQRRKDADATPYINHPIALLRILSVEAGIDDPDVLCAAALHDYLEDCCRHSTPDIPHTPEPPELPDPPQLPDPVSPERSAEGAKSTDNLPTLEQGRALLRNRFGPQVLAYVDALTDDKTLDKTDRKRLQIEHAAHAPHGARLVKLADKIANLRDIAATPPADWPEQRRREYFAWANSVIDRVRGTHPQLESLFDAAHRAGLPR